MTTRKSFPWKFLTFIILVIGTSLIFYDVSKHGHWKKSQSVRTLKEIGVWEYGEKVWDRAHDGFNWTRDRIETYAPGYLDAAGGALHPYVQLFQDLGIIFYNVSITFFNWCKMQSLVIVQMAAKQAPGLLEQAQQFFETFSATVISFSQKACKYLTTEVFVGQFSPENMQKVLVNTLNTTQHYAVEYYNWLYEKVQTTFQGK